MDTAALQRLLDWSRSVRSLAEPVVREHVPADLDRAEARAFAESFRDELGQRRPSDTAFLMHALGADAPVEAPPESASELWSRVVSGQPHAEADEAAAAPLFPAISREGIERWTEEELSGLHALSWLELQRDPQAAADRLAPIARFHVDELQPDNATQRPWAAHVFRIVFESTGEVEHRLHADTLVHACVVRTGRPDVFSALILRDAADAVERFASAFTA
ncbi:MAG: hypothetical protein AAF138_03770 [Planctomycetota bacterium]